MGFSEQAHGWVKKFIQRSEKGGCAKVSRGDLGISPKTDETGSRFKVGVLTAKNGELSLRHHMQHTGSKGG
ncbi:MAG: hypothetical protein J7J91_09005 [Deltaproteobacteria bacterium]|nr:hypothetical protein [Deltaproteobacteria bacterium]